MAIRDNVYIVNIMQDGPAFGVRRDTNESVYISANCRRNLDLELFDDIEAILVPNRVKPEKTPWFCLSATLLEEENEDA